MFTLFEGGADGSWIVDRVVAIVGESVPRVARLNITTRPDQPPRGGPWPLVGFTSNARYTTAAERAALESRQAPLGRPEATRAVLIPIRKNAAWWAMAQDQRREIFEERSRHIAGSLDALPAIARRLHHSRDLGEPFDFLTWFEFAPSDEGRFDALLAFLRASEEWKYVDREVEIRLTRA